MRRLERIEALDRERADPPTLIAELRELVREAEDWARAESDERADAAVETVKEAMANDIVHA